MYDSLLEVASPFAPYNIATAFKSPLEEVTFHQGYITAKYLCQSNERYKKTAYNRAILNAVDEAQPR